jgi:hypothetical protein
VVDCFGKSSGRIGALERGCDFGYANGEWDLDVHGWGARQRVTCADGLGAGVDHGERGGEYADDYVDEPECSTDGNLL